MTIAGVLLNLLHELGLSAEKQLMIMQDNSELRTACRLSREHCTDSVDCAQRLHTPAL